MVTELDRVKVVLAGLYLRGAPRTSRVPPSRWPLVEAALRRRTGGLAESGEALREEGLWAEALAIEEPGLASWATDQLAHGRLVTALCEDYPERLRTRLRASAPPVLWIVGRLPVGPMLSVVGSRSISPAIRRFASEVARDASRLGYVVVSGGAVGCDRAAASGAGGPVVELLPYGIDLYRGRHCALSVCPPGEPFSAAAAMERNALIYACAEQAVVVQSRFREGGTWLGAVEALRRRLCPILVRTDPASQAHRALLALGARGLDRPNDLAEAIRQEGMQGRLIA